MITFPNQSSKQGSNHPSYPVRAAQQFSVVPLRAKTINISFDPCHLLLCRHFSLAPFLFLSLQKLIRSAALEISSSVFPSESRFPLSMTSTTHSPSAMDYLSKIPQVRCFQLFIPSAISVLVLHLTVSLPSL